MRPRNKIGLILLWVAGMTCSAYGSGAGVEWLIAVGSQVAGTVVGFSVAWASMGVRRAAFIAALATASKARSGGVAQ